MNKKLQKQIKAYAGVAGAILSAEKLNAQVLFTDIPDDTIPNAVPFLCDIDNDGTSDFQFGLCTGFIGGVSNSTNIYGIYCLGANNNNKILSTNIPGYFIYSCIFHKVVVLNFADTIPPSLPPNNFDRGAKLERWVTHSSWGGSSSTFFSAAGPLNQDFCLGIMFSINGQNHFGWIKVELLDREVIIKEYAYQSQPNVPILACDTTNLATGVAENNFQFNFFQQNNFIHISSFQNLNQANISVYDLLGKEILQQPFEGKKTTIKIDKKGIYFVEVEGEKGVSRKKVFIY